MLNREDFRSPDNEDGPWLNLRHRNREGGIHWTLSGNCPCCQMTLLIDMARVITNPESLLPTDSPVACDRKETVHGNR
jgi:hypothetical protein